MTDLKRVDTLESFSDEQSVDAVAEKEDEDYSRFFSQLFEIGKGIIASSQRTTTWSNETDNWVGAKEHPSTMIYLDDDRIASDLKSRKEEDVESRVTHYQGQEYYDYYYIKTEKDGEKRHGYLGSMEQPSVCSSCGNCSASAGRASTATTFPGAVAVDGPGFSTRSLSYTAGDDWGESADEELPSSLLPPLPSDSIAAESDILVEASVVSGSGRSRKRLPIYLASPMDAPEPGDAVIVSKRRLHKIAAVLILLIIVLSISLLVPLVGRKVDRAVDNNVTDITSPNGSIPINEESPEDDGDNDDSDGDCRRLGGGGGGGGCRGDRDRGNRDRGD